MRDIRLGRLIWTDVVDPQGNPAGEHAAIVLTAKEEHEAGKPIRAVVVSSKLTYAPKEWMVEMPSDPKGHPQTKFRVECAAMCHWIVEVDETRINKYGSIIYGQLLTRVMECIAQARQLESHPNNPSV
ncbi:MAG: type II toxin-antitoxin system PemK/MazF family toxin [Gemmataceae bacterium]